MRKKISTIVTFVGCTAALAATSAWAIGPAPTWHPRQIVATGIDTTFGHDGADRILAYDHHGNPGIAYNQVLLKYARNVPGAGWQSGTAEGTFGGVFPSLAYDRYERPVIVSSNNVLTQIRTTSFNGLTWNTVPFDVNGPYNYISLAFDTTGKMAAAYRDMNALDLKYVKDTDGDGLLSDEAPVFVTSSDNQGWYATLAFDPLDRPMITHQDRAGNDLKFSVLDAGVGWITTAVDSVGLTGYHCSLAVDPDNGYPAIAYFDDDVDNLRYASWNGTSWDLTTIDSTGDVGRYPSLAFDPADGNPAISYHDLTNGDLKLAWFNGTSWQTQPVDTVGTVGTYTSLAFNDYGTGFPAIAYVDSANTLYFIEDPPAVPEPAAILLALIAAIPMGLRLVGRVGIRSGA